MSSSQSKEYICTNCENSVDSMAKFCPYCGDLFNNEFFCMKHSFTRAIGICIICHTPFCVQCGESVRGIHLCTNHNKLDIIEDMVCIYSNSNEINIKYAYQQLKQNGLNPFLFYKGRRPVSLDYSLVGNLVSINEREPFIIKIMMPFSEYLRAENILKDLEIL